MTLGVNIRKARKAFGLNQTEFAEKMGVSQTAISLWEAGRDKPSALALYRLADVTGDKSFIAREVLTRSCEPSDPAELKRLSRTDEEIVAELVAIRQSLEEANQRMKELLTEYKIIRRRK